jgi:uroporphyrinogen decarboxylase
MSNQKFTNALKRIPQDCPPIWFMRQAGRYHDHYQELKKKYTFEQLCKNPELAAQTALGPIEDFDFDVSILFSDILFPLEALGMNLKYNPGPQLTPLLSDLDSLKTFKPFEEASQFLNFQSQAVQYTRELLPDNKSLIGFIGGPWTLFTYALEGVHKGHMINSKRNEELYHGFCEQMLPLLDFCINEQLKSGAEIVMIFDTSAGELSASEFKQFVYPALEYLSGKHQNKVAYYGKGTTRDQIIHLKNLSLAGMGYDHRFNLATVLAETTKGFVQGNFDQALLFCEPHQFERKLQEYLRPLQQLTKEERSGWVCGLGHGVLPKTPQINVKRFVKKIREVFS